MRTKLIASIVIVLIASIVIGAVLYDSSEPNCEEEYEKVLDGDLDSSEVSETCKPIPEDIENQLLVQALGNN